MVAVVSFGEALRKTEGARNRHLILGNGFSIALKPDIFTYQSLYENADFSQAPHLPAIFDALRTRDFEVVIRALQSAAAILSEYRGGYDEAIGRLTADAAFLKSALVTAVAKRHPDRPYDVAPEQYAACRAFLSNFGHKFTLNYDVLLYWTLMQSEVDELDLHPDDGFRHPDNPDEPYVSWQEANLASVLYLHGALHLFDTGTEIIKYTWSKTDIPIVEQIRTALEEDRFPLFVSEGATEQKWERIMHNAYLHKAIRSLDGCCRSPTSAVFIFGHSLAPNDNHVLRQIAEGGVTDVLVSLYGDPESLANKEVIANAEALKEWRLRVRPGRPLAMTFYDAASAHVWG